MVKKNTYKFAAIPLKSKMVAINRRGYCTLFVAKYIAIYIIAGTSSSSNTIDWVRSKVQVGI